MTNEIKEKAREYAEQPLTGAERALLFAKRGDFERLRGLIALGFEAGAASRDREIEVLKAQLDLAKRQRNSVIGNFEYNTFMKCDVAKLQFEVELAALEQK